MAEKGLGHDFTRHVAQGHVQGPLQSSLAGSAFFASPATSTAAHTTLIGAASTDFPILLQNPAPLRRFLTGNGRMDDDHLT